ncbi:GxxExxY protein [Sphingobacteriales bacterium CHB3]|nr:GxxExxY protein [Sphingobacteriales bacterium CHB3]
MQADEKQKTEYAPLSEREEEIGRNIVESALSVHRALGPGLLEKVYEVCFCHELRKRGFEVQPQIEIPIQYDGITFDEGMRCDVLVESLVICELKAVEQLNPVWDAQLLSQLRMANKRLGNRINFNVPLIKGGIKRIIN